ncbi:MAG: MFS transporter [Deltaproteobacteria bacterium]|nr:MFS transporter [Deltaproteobacteria bacterium]
MAWQPYHSVWFILGFGWIALYLVRMGISPVLGLIMEEFHLSHAAAGALFSVIFYSYSAMQLPAGHLGDRFGRKKILVAGTLLWFFLSLATAAVRSFGMLVVVRFLTGIAHGIYFGNDRPTIIAHTPKEKMGKGQGISFIGLALGFFLSVFLAGLIADAFGNWRWVFVIFSLPSLLASFLIHRYIHEPDREPSGPSETAPHFRRAFTDGNLWLMYITGFVMLYGFWLVATWMPAIYREIGVTDITTGALLSGVLGLMGMAGLLVSSILTDRLALLGYGRKGFVSVCILVWALLMMATGYAVENHPSQILISILFLSSGLFVFGVWPPYYALLSELVPQSIAGTTFGLANLVGFLSAWVAPWVTGWIKDTTGSFSAGLYLASGLLVLVVPGTRRIWANGTSRGSSAGVPRGSYPSPGGTLFPIRNGLKPGPNFGIHAVQVKRKFFTSMQRFRSLSPCSP